MNIDAGRHGDASSSNGGDSDHDSDHDSADDGRAATPLARLDDGPDGSQAAARLLEMTARETDQWRSEARSEAAAMVAGAREESANLVRAAREEAERLVASAREEAAQTTNDARVEAYRVREETAALRKRHDQDIAHLEQVASEHQARLRHHLTEMLHQVDSISGESDE